MSVAQQCKITGCHGIGKLVSNGKRYMTKGYCLKHYSRVVRGLIVDAPSRRDRRKPLVSGHIARVPLGVCARQGYSLIDSTMVELVGGYNWYLDGRGYPTAHKSTGFIKLHHLVIGKPVNGLVVDHINRNKLDNRVSNLRFATLSTNGINSERAPAKSSGVRGVNWSKSHNYWVAVISAGGRRYSLGCYRDINDAIEARKQGELKYHTI